jgi:hypothetical protein
MGSAGSPDSSVQCVDDENNGKHHETDAGKVNETREPAAELGRGKKIENDVRNRRIDRYANGKTRTTEEKMEILGGMLGNVDALVEGVRKAGVWGLG